MLHVDCRTRERRRRHETTTCDRRLLKRLETSRCDSPGDCQYRAFIYARHRPGSCYYCTHCREACCPASWVSAGGGSPLLAPGPDSAATVDEGGLTARTPALYCSCGVVRGTENQLNDTDVDRKSDDDEVAPPGGVGDELANSGCGTGLVMQNTIRLMLPAEQNQHRTEGRHRHWSKQQQQQQSTRLGHNLIDDDSQLRPTTNNTPPIDTWSCHQGLELLMDRV